MCCPSPPPTPPKLKSTSTSMEVSSLGLNFNLASIRSCSHCRLHPSQTHPCLTTHFLAKHIARLQCLGDILREASPFFCSFAQSRFSFSVRAAFSPLAAPMSS